MKIKDLKIAYNVLCELDYPVEEQLLVHLSQRIRAIETRTAERRLSRMSEEQLIHESEKQKRTIRIYTPDGRLIQKTTSEATYRAAVQQFVDVEAASRLGLQLGRREVIRRDETMLRRRYKHYFYLQPGYFLLDAPTAADRYAILRLIDEGLHLNWEIELV